MSETYRAKCGHCDGKGYVTPMSRMLYGDCRNCNGSGWITDLSADDVVFLQDHDPDRLELLPPPGGSPAESERE